ncbi:MAG: hypothetical protein O3C34_06990 [Proteobacteria bacterium]|nr:hypothetical protein [Pseudomonadota bacterium]
MNEITKMYDLIEEPRGKIYQALLMYAQKKCPYFLLVEPPGAGVDSEGTAVLLSLVQFLVEEKATKEWPGTIHLGNREATAFTFNFTPESLGLLLDATNGLYEWRLPSRPENLSLLRPDRSPWLTSIAHETDAYFKISEKEKSELVSEIPDLDGLLAKR